MFSKLKTIGEQFLTVRRLSFLALLGCILISGWAIYSGRQEAAQAAGRIYVLSNGKAMRAEVTDVQENLPVEARDHLRNFHHYFFDLGPDEKGSRRVWTGAFTWQTDRRRSFMTTCWRAGLSTG